MAILEYSGIYSYSGIRSIEHTLSSINGQTDHWRKGRYSPRTGSLLRGAQQLINRSAQSAGNEVRSAEQGEPARKSHNL